jgi:hypothetical protein
LTSYGDQAPSVHAKNIKNLQNSNKDSQSSQADQKSPEMQDQPTRSVSQVLTFCQEHWKLYQEASGTICKYVFQPHQKVRVQAEGKDIQIYCHLKERNESRFGGCR